MFVPFTIAARLTTIHWEEGVAEALRATAHGKAWQRERTVPAFYAQRWPEHVARTVAILGVGPVLGAHCALGVEHAPMIWPVLLITMVWAGAVAIVIGVHVWLRWWLRRSPDFAWRAALRRVEYEGCAPPSRWRAAMIVAAEDGDLPALTWSENFARGVYQRVAIVQPFVLLAGDCMWLVDTCDESALQVAGGALQSEPPFMWRGCRVGDDVWIDSPPEPEEAGAPAWVADMASNVAYRGRRMRRLRGSAAHPVRIGIKRLQPRRAHACPPSK